MFLAKVLIPPNCKMVCMRYGSMLDLTVHHLACDLSLCLMTFIYTIFDCTGIVTKWIICRECGRILIYIAPVPMDTVPIASPATTCDDPLSSLTIFRVHPGIVGIPPAFGRTLLFSVSLAVKGCCARLAVRRFDAARFDSFRSGAFLDDHGSNSWGQIQVESVKDFRPCHDGS